MDEMSNKRSFGDYLSMAAQKLGMTNGKPAEVPVDSQAETRAERIGKKQINEAIQTLKDYKDAKRNFESRIVEEEQWWRLRHWDVIRGQKENKDGERPEPTSAWLFNSLTGKHADIMDNYPQPNVLPRERADEQDAKTLSSILPVIFERNEYEDTYSDAGWYKLKHGVAAKGVFWDKELDDGLGDIAIRNIDMLNIFWEPGIRDIQASRNLFIVDLRDNDLLEEEYPQLKGKTGGMTLDVKQYVYDDTVDVSQKSVVVDWYYKKNAGLGKTVLHYCKFCGNTVLYASENDPEYAEIGFYDHGKYPVVFDVLFPMEGTPVGFGYIAVMRSPQLYIDKLSQIILENSMMATRTRFFAKKNVGINKDQFLNWDEPIVDVEGDISEERLRQIEVEPVSSQVLSVYQMKIDELKETSSNRDVSQGSTGSGVTAAAAISALQEAGNKTSRDMINASFRSFTQECYLAIELIRQFYDEKRSFRITGDTGKYEYIQYNNANLQGQPIAPVYPGQENELGYTEATRKPVFDIVIKPEKRSAYSKLSQNELAIQLYQLGFFNPQLAEQSMTALELMDFDGKEKVKDRVQQGQTLMNQMAAMQEAMNKMGMIIFRLTGEDVLGLSNGGGAPGAQIAQEGRAGATSAETNAKKETMTAYGERLAKKATPNVSES